MTDSKQLDIDETDIDKSDLPTSFGSFKPTGHVMVGMPSVSSLQALRQALLDEGWPENGMLRFTPKETVEEMRELIDNASPLAGFGSELKMMRRYLDESQRGTRWLLVVADERDQTEKLASLAKANGARLAVSYGRLVIEELI